MDHNRKWMLRLFAAALALLAALAGVLQGRAEDVSCTGSLGAISVDSLSVPANATCTLNGTQVDGNLSVGSNATLHASDIRVNGNIMTDGAAQVNVTAGSTVNGNVEIEDSGAANIQAVDIHGNLFFDGNDGPLQAANNTIDGNLQVFGNSGGVTINNNTIDGDLQCSGNSPPPSGSGNNVDGDMEGQCADLGAAPPPASTNTPQPPTNTPQPPTNTPTPTNTPQPPTNTPTPTNTPLPPTNPPPVATHTPTATPPAATHTPTSTGTAPLVANEDRYTLTGEAIHVPAPGILANDLLAGPAPVEVVLVRPPQHGTVTLGQAGDFTYQAQSGYFGDDSFDYRLRRAGIQSSPATVHLTMIDQQAPTVRWVAPVLAGERYDVRDGVQLLLEAEASDNRAVGKVEFLRWDAVKEEYVSLGSVSLPPYRLAIDTATLNPEWNQVFVIATDLAGNRSDQPFIWLYKLLVGPLNNRIYMPFTSR